MCGIVGYVGDRQAYPIIIAGLKRLEYRGYDSAGICIANPDPKTYKCRGRVQDLENKVGQPLPGSLGIGHTRWATHGEPNDDNAHPHTSQHGKFTLVHNGIIENYTELKHKLEKRGYNFVSATDTEVLANLIEYIYMKGEITPEMAVRLALSKVVGAYGLAIIAHDMPDCLIAARKGSSLVIGVGDSEYFIASDSTPIVEHTNRVIFLNDNDVAILGRNQMTLKTIHNKSLEPNIQKIDLDIEAIEKGGFDHFMLKEIFEQPRSIHDTFRGRLSAEYDIHLGGLLEHIPALTNANRIIFVACGTSWHAAQVGKYLIEDLAKIATHVEYASEFRYRNPVLLPNDVVIAISQSGETADTLAAIKLAKEKGALVLGICNVVGSSIARETVSGVYTHAGPEIGVASTKAFTAQVTVLIMMAILLAKKRRTIEEDTRKKLIKEMMNIPQHIEQILKLNPQILDISKKFVDATNFLYLGRGHNYPVALEGALKLKEISYIHAEGYPAAEMKHGPIALIDQTMPVVVIAIKDHSYDKIVSNIQEVKARKGIIIAIVTEGDTTIRNMADHVIEIPAVADIVSPLLTVIPLQLLAYHIALLRGCNVDQPRNLAKSVTVE